MVEVDGVAEVDFFEFVERGGGVVQRVVEVDAGDGGGEAVDGVMPVNGRSVPAILAPIRVTPSVTARW